MESVSDWRSGVSSSSSMVVVVAADWSGLVACGIRSRRYCKRRYQAFAGRGLDCSDEAVPLHQHGQPKLAVGCDRLQLSQYSESEEVNSRSLPYLRATGPIPEATLLAIRAIVPDERHPSLAWVLDQASLYRHHSSTTLPSLSFSLQGSGNVWVPESGRPIRQGSNYIHRHHFTC